MDVISVVSTGYRLGRFGLPMNDISGVCSIYSFSKAKSSRAHSMKSCHHNNPQTGYIPSSKQLGFLSLLNDDA